MKGADERAVEFAGATGAFRWFTENDVFPD